MTLKEKIISDLYRYNGKTNIKVFILSFIKIEGFRYMVFHRILSTLSRKNPFYWLIFFIKRYYGHKYGFQIFTNNIGYGFYIGHYGTIIINEKAILGNNVNISPGVVIGQISSGKKKGVPIIGNNVWIGSNSILVGNINIGDNAMIAPGAYVNFNVPNNSIVFGNPGIIKENKSVEGYICNVWEKL